MTRLARVVFLVLVGATFSAFFVAQELKSRPSVVDVQSVLRNFSPNGDGVRDVSAIAFAVREPDEVTVSIVDEGGGEVRRLVDVQPAQPSRVVSTSWDGRTDEGRPAPDGRYRVRIGLRRRGRSVVLPRPIRLDTEPPEPVVSRITDEQRVVDVGTRDIGILVRGGVRKLDTPQFSVWRTDSRPARRVATFAGEQGKARAAWDGLVDGEPAQPGTYLIAATLQDKAGNTGSSASGLPKLPDRIRGSAGVTVRAIVAQGPLEPVRAGDKVTFFVDARGHRYSWQIRRVGEGPQADRRVRRGKKGKRRVVRIAAPHPAQGPRLVIRAPERESGLYLLELKSRGYRATVPFAVQSADRRRLLVVLPALTWVGQAPVDEGGDGLPDTLERRGPVPTGRVLTPDGTLPAGLADEVAPLLVSLDRTRVRYDITTDLALAGSRDPRASDRTGVLLAGPHRWIPNDLGRRLRQYALDGGSVASYGTGTLRAGVTLASGRLLRPTAPPVNDVFGAELEPPRTLPAPADGAAAPVLAPIAGDAGHSLLTGFDGTLEGFHAFEEARLRDDGRRKLLAAIGEPLTTTEEEAADADGVTPREPLPVLSATQVGEGLVIRVGLPEWGKRLQEDEEVAQLQRNIVDLLRGREPRPGTAAP